MPDARVLPLTLTFPLIGWAALTKSSYVSPSPTIEPDRTMPTPENLRAWVDDPAALKSGALMPAMKLSRQDLDTLTAYLVTLR